MIGTNSNAYNYFDSTGKYISGGLDSGDTAWMLTSTALVLLMTMPGLAIYYSGMVRDKNVLACKTQNMCKYPNKITPYNIVMTQI